MADPLTPEEERQRVEWARDFMDRGRFHSQAEPPLRGMSESWAEDVLRFAATLDAVRAAAPSGPLAYHRGGARDSPSRCARMNRCVYCGWLIWPWQRRGWEVGIGHWHAKCRP